ncbi:iron complex transport system substrate-binding protein [Actinopolyspora biskrensis]|uniref:Iron complex transport system substrate-binding protein n=1 Tax=Actinopolyspora biskrensis TaxID=1470178 RepID=A0A852YVK7_9ACTN|nr:ABC transporter substrate-binding protein [Actinopolyspora biskrensis]NYH78090.1 iron complex transport system substrate-binding protein [Actinopolyspora biskrensis]
MSRTIGLRRNAALLLAVFALLVPLTSCASRPTSNEQPDSGNDSASAFPVRVELSGRQPVTLTEQPKRIVSLSPTATEVLYEIGADEQVIAVDKNSDHPGRAPRKEFSALDTSASAVSEYRPDLVIAQAGSADSLADGLREIDVPVLLTPSAENLQDSYDQIKALGRATGHGERATETVNRMRSRMDELVERTPEPQGELTYYHEISPDHFTSTSESFVGNVYRKFGLTNIADSAGDSKFPRLSEEKILRADPDMIFLADTGSAGVTKEKVSRRPGWNNLTAVREGRIHELDEDIANRWGPRVVELARSISEAVDSAQKS